MSGVFARFAPPSIALLLLLLSACSSLDPPKQWYKPDSRYTTADFQRDQSACTKDRVLDEDCLKQRGWIPLSGDQTKPTPPPSTTSGTRTRPY